MTIRSPDVPPFASHAAPLVLGFGNVLLGDDGAVNRPLLTGRDQPGPQRPCASAPTASALLADTQRHETRPVRRRPRPGEDSMTATNFDIRTPQR